MSFELLMVYLAIKIPSYTVQGSQMRWSFLPKIEGCRIDIFKLINKKSDLTLTCL